MKRIWTTRNDLTNNTNSGVLLIGKWRETHFGVHRKCVTNTFRSESEMCKYETNNTNNGVLLSGKWRETHFGLHRKCVTNTFRSESEMCKYERSKLKENASSKR